MNKTLSDLTKARVVLKRWDAAKDADYNMAWWNQERSEQAHLIRPLVARNDRLEYLLKRLQPADCTCHIEGPDGIECLRCEVASEVPPDMKWTHVVVCTHCGADPTYEHGKVCPVCQTPLPVPAHD